jgi:glycyl-tRNA synthetase beta chain
MQGNQKYFPVVSADGRLLPHFIAVSNIRSTRPETVREGNERVIRPRFADAEFFWNQDRKQTLTNLESTLDTVVYQEKLGSLRDRAARIAALAGQLCGPAEQADAELAGRLCKCDLLTNMVGEFPELQGIMGRHYAQHDGLPDAVAIAIGEHYHPRFAGDTLPESAVGRAVAVADKLDTLVGIFGIGQRPSGDRDPFALRRAALGVLRISLEGGFDLDLDAALQHAVAGYGTRLTEADTAGQVYQFLLERLRGYYAEAGFAAELFDAVAALRPAQPRDFDRRLRAVAAFLELPEATSLAAANKRIHNILRQAQTPVRADVDTALLTEPAEQALAMALAAQREAVAPDLERGDYTAALTRLAGLRGPVDRFFDDVMVMVEDPALRTNRLALLQELSGLFLRVADLSCLPG